MVRRAAAPESILSALTARRGLIVVTGKGGVGKTTLAAAIGTSLAAAGRRVMLLEADPRQNLHHAVGLPPSEGEVGAAGPRLWIQNLESRVVLEELVRAKLKIPALARRVTGSAVFQHFAAGAPGFKEMALLGHALRLARGEIKPRVDVVVLDAPATGHGVSLLLAPKLVADVITSGPVADLAAQVSAFVADQERCALVVATLADELPVQESLELLAALDARLGRGPELVVANALFPPVPSGTAPAGSDVAMTLWRARRAENERELARLRAAWRGPLLELPLLPLEGAPLAAALAERLAP